MDPKFRFEVTHVDPSGARTGILHTRHGDVETPMFMPVGTLATVKTLDPDEIKGLGSGVILSNAYHLHLRPGEDIVERAGGLHAFMGYDGPILTDSGGFQVFSLAKKREIKEEGVFFRNDFNGNLEEFTPEKVIAIEEKLGPDIAMSFDECIPYPADFEYVKKSTERTIRWAKRGLTAHRRLDQALFGIVQGGAYPDLREMCAKELAALPFDGYSIGGTSIGEPKEICFSMVEDAVRYLPESKPRYLMGVGSIDYLLGGAMRGVDMFDCVLPTRLARHGALMTSSGRINIRDSRYKDDFTPLSTDCDCYACTHFTKAYLHHLFVTGEELGKRLNTLHNLRFLISLLEGARRAIKEDRFSAYLGEAIEKFGDLRGF